VNLSFHKGKTLMSMPAESNLLRQKSEKAEHTIITGKPLLENMVWIPGGTFMMGSDKHYPEEAPAHEVTVDGFWMDIHTVTNEEFRRFAMRPSTSHQPNARLVPRTIPARSRNCSSLLQSFFKNQNNASISATATNGGPMFPAPTGAILKDRRAH
jgi:formylglycine-generating enzyme required for sulfatase activity